jgi:hypothetical protein
MRYIFVLWNQISILQALFTTIITDSQLLAKLYKST